mmetsp:Transcript_14912/g.26551  ORF Transcript_14912/g.26551 Transcript_14912/m.26551 type:complete len:116 (+) Transcript_14912:712-1059(+)
MQGAAGKHWRRPVAACPGQARGPGQSMLYLDTMRREGCSCTRSRLVWTQAAAMVALLRPSSWRTTTTGLRVNLSPCRLRKSMSSLEDSTVLVRSLQLSAEVVDRGVDRKMTHPQK